MYALDEFRDLCLPGRAAGGTFRSADGGSVEGQGAVAMAEARGAEDGTADKNLGRGDRSLHAGGGSPRRLCAQPEFQAGGLEGERPPHRHWALPKTAGLEQSADYLAS